MATSIGDQTATVPGFFEQMSQLPSGIAVAGKVPSNAQASTVVTDGAAGTLAALETALGGGLTVYRWKFFKADGVTPIYLVFFT